MAGCILWVTREVLGLNAAVAARMALPAASPHLTAVLTVVPCFGVPHGGCWCTEHDGLFDFLVSWDCELPPQVQAAAATESPLLTDRDLPAAVLSGTSCTCPDWLAIGVSVASVPPGWQCCEGRCCVVT